ncbi:uracil-DNA glycosylase [Bradyrhizobium sp. UFLA06-06]
MTISTSNLVTAATRPDSNCPLCPRLAEFRAQARAREPGWFNSPVESFGDPNARLLIVGLAPGLQGANRTGRPFTGDYAGDLLYATLLEYGFASGVYQARPDDGLKLVDALSLIHIVRRQRQMCIRDSESTLKALDVRLAAAPFVHGAVHSAGKFKLYDSYHCSRYNTNTGVLTTDMFRKVFATVRKELG